MKILCNLPLECFDERASFDSVELVTFGPRDRMVVDGELFPFDIEFDPSTGSIGELWSRLPADFAPDLLLIWWPDQEPLPRDLRACPVRVVGVLSDYNLSLPSVAGLWPFFDVLLVDRGGVDLFPRLSFADVRYFCQYTFKARSHRIHQGLPRDVDVGFAGNLNPVVQRQRAPWIDRLRRLPVRGHRVAITSGVFGADYGRLLSRSKIGFNRSIRGEINLRAFEVAACGGCLFMERSNREVRDFFVPGEECVLYGDDDFEDLVDEYLADAPRLRRVAAAGHARVQHHRMGNRLAALRQILDAPGPGRPSAEPLAVHLGRGLALLQTWANPASALADLVAAQQLAPDDPRPGAAMAMALLELDPAAHAVRALLLLERCCAQAPHFLPSLHALAWLHEQMRSNQADHWRERLCAATHAALDFADVDGLAMPLGYSARSIDLAAALAESVLLGRVSDGLRAAYRPQQPSNTERRLPIPV